MRDLASAVEPLSGKLAARCSRIRIRAALNGRRAHRLKDYSCCWRRIRFDIVGPAQLRKGGQVAGDRTWVRAAIMFSATLVVPTEY